LGLSLIVLRIISLACEIRSLALRERAITCVAQRLPLSYSRSRTLAKFASATLTAPVTSLPPLGLVQFLAAASLKKHLPATELYTDSQITGKLRQPTPAFPHRRHWPRRAGRI
jgi:hypothetical protein